MYRTIYATYDEFNNGQAPGWAILFNDERVDWPLVASEDEALADIADFHRADRELEEEAASERRIGC